MMYAYTEMAVAMGHEREKVIWLDIGDVVAFDGNEVEMLEPIESAGNILVDGLSEGGVSHVILRDRRHLADNGTVIVTIGLDRASGEVVYGPDIISRGFLHPEDAEELFEEARNRVLQALNDMDQEDEADWDNVRGSVRDVVARYLNKKTKRRP